MHHLSSQRALSVPNRSCPVCRSYPWSEGMFPVNGHHPSCRLQNSVGCSIAGDYQVARQDEIGSIFDDIASVVTAPARSVASAISSAPSAVVVTAQQVAKGAQAAAPYVMQAVPYVQMALKNIPPLGTVASAAIGVMATGLRGGNLEDMAWAAAEGAAPSGVDTAVRAAHALRNGDSLLNAALDVARKEIVPGGAVDAGFRAGETLLRGGTVSQAAINAARTQMNTPEQLAGFNLAVGTLARAAIRQSGGVSPGSGVRLPPMVTTASIARSPALTKASAVAKVPAQAVASVPRFIPAATAVSDFPKPLPHQPILSGPTPGLLVLSDGQIRRGSFAPGTSGVVKALLVLNDGRIVRNLFKV